MKQNVYCVKNTLSGIHSGLYLFPTDALASIELTLGLAPRNYSEADKKKYISSELELYNIGTFDVENKELVSTEPKFIAWDFRRFVETPMNNHINTIESEFAENTGNI